jgi:hypothetical protein
MTWSWATPRPHAREAGAGSVRLVGRVSAHGHIPGLKPSLFSKLFFQFANYFEFNSNLNFKRFLLTKENKIRAHTNTKEKVCIGMNATNNCLFK